MRYFLVLLVGVCITAMFLPTNLHAQDVSSKDINPGSGNGNPTYLMAVGTTLFFRAFEVTNGYELWTSDGTEGGTVLVKDINPGSGDSLPDRLTNMGSTLFFRANDGTNGVELWTSDGTEGGTVLVQDINPGSGNSYPDNLTDMGGTLFFQADDGTNGTELWGMTSLLPVEMTSFTAIADGPDMLLRWETASETNNAGFEIQHRADDTWHLLGFIDGHGTTAAPNAYQHRVETLAPGVHRFRLKQIDYDGTFDYSPEVEVARGLAEVYRMTLPYPSPLKDGAAQFSLSVARQQHVAVVVYDMLGRRRMMLFEGEMAASTTRALQLNGSGLPSGMYMIRVEGEHFITTRPLTVAK